MRTNPIELRSGDARVVVDPDRGGRLASCSIAGRELLVGPATPDDRSIWWGCFLMAPWPGRLANGQLEWAGGTFQLPRTHGEHAIHGLLWDRAWDITSSDPSAATLSIALGAAGWPFAGEVRHAIHLEPDQLVMTATVEAAERMPAALGWHPWFVGDEHVRLRVAADSVLVTQDMLPTGQIAAVEGATDLRAAPPRDGRRLDHAYVGASSPVDVVWPGFPADVAFDPTPATVVIYTPAGRFCVEPQTAWPNALGLPASDRRGAGVRDLAPGESLVATMRIRWRGAIGT